MYLWKEGWHDKLTQIPLLYRHPYGIDYPNNAARASILEEGIQLIDMLWNKKQTVSALKEVFQDKWSNVAEDHTNKPKGDSYNNCYNAKQDYADSC